MGNSNLDAVLAEADDRVACALAAATEDPAPASLEEAVEKVTACVTANHANTLPLLACLRAVPEPVPYRAAADAVDALPVMALTTQNAYVLFDLLVRAGGVAAIPVEESAPAAASETGVPAVAVPAAEAPVASAAATKATKSAKAPAAAVLVPADAPASADAANPPAFPAAASTAPVTDSLPDQPVDHLLVVTEAGRAVLGAFEPTRRFAALIEQEPAGYADAYARVLDLCARSAGASRADIEEVLAGHPALFSPKQIYPNYFISKLETVDGISWDGCWHVTESGLRMRALVG